MEDLRPFELLYVTSMLQCVQDQVWCSLKPLISQCLYSLILDYWLAEQNVDCVDCEVN
jgi:hypothetical protein